jgi:Trk K+ transport system NAD-binding subunit
VGVIQGGNFHPNPKPDYRFNPGDLVAVIGKPPEIQDFRNWAETEDCRPIDILDKAKDE